MKIIAKIVIIIAVFFAGLYVGQQQVSAPPRQEYAGGQATEQKVSLMLDFGDGVVKTYQDVEWREEMSVFDLLKAVAEKNNLQFSYKDYGGDMGMFIESVDNRKNSAKGDFWWQYWVNNEYGEIGSGKKILKPGDAVEWKLVKGQLK